MGKYMQDQLKNPEQRFSFPNKIFQHFIEKETWMQERTLALWSLKEEKMQSREQKM